MEKLRLYHAYGVGGEHLCGIIAKSAKEAKQEVFGSEYTEDETWIELSVKWEKGIDINGFSEGIINDQGNCFVAIKRGIFKGQGDGCEYAECYKECTKFLNTSENNGST